MKKILLNNLSLKLLAVLIGCIIWVAVMYDINPIDTKTLTVAVNILNGEVISAQNWVYDANDELEVEVTVSANSFDLPRITESNFNLYVDMLYPTGGTGTQRRYQITCEIVGNSDIIQSYSLSTEYIDFEMEELVSKEFEVEVILSGSAADNFTAHEDATATPESVTVTGKSSEVEQIERVVYYLDIDDASEEISETGTPTLLDSDGNVLTDLETITISPETVTVSQTISQTKSVVVTCNSVSGEPETGYSLAEIVLDTTSVRVTGARSVLSDFVSINIPEEMINIDGLSEDATFAIDLSDLELPDGISFVSSTNIVNVTVKIERNKQSTFRLQLPDDVALSGQSSAYSYSFSDTVVFITVEGISSDVDSMDSTNIVATLNVSGYGAGTYTIELDVGLPDGISLVTTPAVEVVITASEAGSLTVTPTPTPTSETETTEETTQAEETTEPSEEETTPDDGEDEDETGDDTANVAVDD